jgi:ubiquinone/menaquinone biosynthesis C-methylase UbiE
MISEAPVQSETLFENPFHIDDLMVFDDATLHTLLTQESFGLTVELLAHSLQGTKSPLIKRIKRNLSPQQRSLFMQELRRPLPKNTVEQARRQLLDGLFWELTYWKTPELYEELTEGERLHPGIFQRLQPDLRGKTVVDVGAGSGRASLECIRYGVSRVYAVEPSPGLLHIMEQKLAHRVGEQQLIPRSGRFDAIPLPDNSVDLALSCSAFTATPEQGGEPGLAEMLRVTRPGGKIVLIWPRQEDSDWLRSHGFHYVSLPLKQDMHVRFRSLQSALQCARRFYARNKAVARYILTKQKPEIPFSVIGVNPPRDYCWLDVNKPGYERN